MSNARYIDIASNPLFGVELCAKVWGVINGGSDAVVLP